MSIYWTLALVIVVAVSASVATFHYYRPSRKRSPEAAVAVFSAILAAGAWGDSVLDRANQGAEREAEIAALQQLLNSTLTSADAQAARRDDVLAGKIEVGFLKAGLQRPALIVREVRASGSQGSADVAKAIRIAELETERRLLIEQSARTMQEMQAATRRAIRGLCSLDSYKDTDRCRRLEADNPNTEAPAPPPPP